MFGFEDSTVFYKVNKIYELSIFQLLNIKYLNRLDSQHEELRITALYYVLCNKGGYMNSKKDCAGTYPVSGYVRKDGTEVSAYMRTCGAKHEGGVNYLSEEEKDALNVAFASV